VYKELPLTGDCVARKSECNGSRYTALFTDDCTHKAQSNKNNRNLQGKNGI